MAAWIWVGVAAGMATAAVVGSEPVRQRPAVASRANASLCEPRETVIAHCAIGTRQVSICARGSTATYRYGRPGRVELTASDLHWASTGYSGGGELQVTARNAGHSYTLFDRIVRTGFGADGLNYPREDSGLVVRRGAKVLSNRRCTSIQPIAAEVRDLLPEGEFVEH